MVVTERTSSISSSSSSSRKKEKSSLSSEKESDGLPKEKLVRRASSFSCSSPSKKEKQGMNSLPKEKRIRRTNSFSASDANPSSTKKEKKGVSTCQNKKNQPTKEKHEGRKKSAMFKSRIREMGPICKRIQETLQEVEEEEDVDVSLDKQIEEEGKENPNGSFWLSSGSMSPQEFGLFMSSLDPCLDEWVISFLPGSSKTTTTTIPVEDHVQKHEMKESTSSSSSFWNMDRTGVWVSLINLDGEDSKWISDVDSQLEDLDSDFPSPNYEMMCDSYSSDVGFSSSGRSTTQDNSQSELSSDLFSDSMDLECDSDDPIFWPFSKDFNWDDQGWDSFSVSPRKGVYTINFESQETSSIKFRIHATKGNNNSKEGFKRKILFVSGLSASKIIEFKKGCRKNRRQSSKMGKRGGTGHYKRRVAPILENILEESKSPKETPKAKSSSNNLPESTTDWSCDEMDSDGPLFWPSDQKNDWDFTWDSFNISPRKGMKSTNQGSPKGTGFSVTTSVRLRFRPKKGKPKGVINNRTGLSTCKRYRFKPGSHKTNSTPLKLSKSCKWRTNAGNGKRVKTTPLKFGKGSVQDFMKLVSVIGKNKEVAEVTAKELTIETVMGLNEFDGHEGVEPEFEGESFSLDECMRE